MVINMAPTSRPEMAGVSAKQHQTLAISNLTLCATLLTTTYIFSTAYRDHGILRRVPSTDYAGHVAKQLNHVTMSLSLEAARTRPTDMSSSPLASPEGRGRGWPACSGGKRALTNAAAPLTSYT